VQGGRRFFLNLSCLHPSLHPWKIKAKEDAKVPDLSNQKLITNRQLNFTLSPVDTHNSKEMPYKLQNYEIDGTWNHHQSIILDVILDRFVRGYYKHYYKKLPKSWRSNQTLETAKNGIGALVNPEAMLFMSLSPYDAFALHVGDDVLGNLEKDYYYHTNPVTKRDEYKTFEEYVHDHFKQNIVYQQFFKRMQDQIKNLYQDFPIRFDILKLFEEYPLNKYRRTLIDSLEKIEQTKFKMTYKVKYIAQEPKFDNKGKRTNEGQLIDLYYNMQDFQNIFKVNAGKAEIVLNFNTPLGKLILHNMLILDTDWCPIESMALPKNAYFIYKRFVFNKRFGKRKSKAIELNFDEIKRFLNLNWSNNGGVYAIINRALKDMVKNELIGGFRSEKHHINKRRYHLYFSKMEINQNKAADGYAGILKFN